MTRFLITVALESDNSVIADLNCDFMPRIGEKLMYPNAIYIIKSIRYDMSKLRWTEQHVLMLVERVDS